MNFLLKAVMAVSEGEAHEGLLADPGATAIPVPRTLSHTYKQEDGGYAQQHKRVARATLSAAASSSPLSFSSSGSGSHEDDVEPHAHAILMLRGAASSASQEGSLCDVANSPDGSDASSGTFSSSGQGSSKGKGRRMKHDSKSPLDMARMREVNRQAAKRHRQMAKARRMEIAEKLSVLSKRNESLRGECGDLQSEISLLRASIVQAFAAQGDGRPLEGLRRVRGTTQCSA